jgi:triosephosphate isomerase
MNKVIIANWKMNLSVPESIDLARQYKKISFQERVVVVCPDFCSLSGVGEIIKGSKNIFLGAQDSAAFDKGAYTGEVSPLTLQSLGVKYVIIGHSERRKNLHENSALINNKIKFALEAGLIPVVCIGEKLTEKNNGHTKPYLLRELRRILKGVKIKKATDLIIAYEPVWAISTNKNAKPMMPEEADDIHLFLKKKAKGILKENINILYGGSVKSDNATSFLEKDNVDGLLVGAASLRASDFTDILTSC